MLTDTLEKTSKLDRASLFSVLNDLGQHLAEQGVTMEIALYGGAAIMMHFEKDRDSTSDIDYVLRGNTKSVLNDAINDIGHKHCLGGNWMNDAVEIFVAPNANHLHMGDFPRDGECGLRVYAASPEFLLALKVMSARCSLTTKDWQDIWNLADHLGIKDAGTCVEIARTYDPEFTLDTHKMLRLEDLFTNKALGKSYNPMDYY